MGGMRQSKNLFPGKLDSKLHGLSSLLCDVVPGALMLVLVSSQDDLAKDAQALSMQRNQWTQRGHRTGRTVEDGHGMT